MPVEEGGAARKGQIRDKAEQEESRCVEAQLVENEEDGNRKRQRQRQRESWGRSRFTAGVGAE